MHAVHRGPGDAPEIAGAAQGFGLDERRPGVVPGGKAALALRVGRHHPVAQHPGDLDVLGMRAQHAAMGRQGLQQPEQEAVVGPGQAEPRALVAADVHEQLRRRHAAGDVAGQLGELVVGGDDEVQSEIDSRASLGNRHQLVEYSRIGFGAHHVGDKAGHPPDRRRAGLGGGVRGDARARDVGPVAEMDMGVDGARQHGQAGHRDRLRRRAAAARRGHRRDAAIGDQDIRLGQPGVGQQHGAARQPQIDLGHPRASVPPPALRSGLDRRVKPADDAARPPA